MECICLHLCRSLVTIHAHQIALLFNVIVIPSIEILQCTGVKIVDLIAYILAAKKLQLEYFCALILFVSCCMIIKGITVDLLNLNKRVLNEP